MKRTLFVVLAAFSAATAFAADSKGSLEVVSDFDNGPGDFVVGGGFVSAPQFQVADDGSTLYAESGGTIYLKTQNGGYQGFVDGRPFNLVCTATACTDNGSTQLEIKVTPLNDGFRLQGSLNYTSVDATFTSSKISISTMGGNTDESVELTRDSDGAYRGQGVAQAYDTFQMSVTGTGSLACLTPAQAIVLLVSPLVGN